MARAKGIGGSRVLEELPFYLCVFYRSFMRSLQVVVEELRSLKNEHEHA